MIQELYVSPDYEVSITNDCILIEDEHSCKIHYRIDGHRLDVNRLIFKGVEYRPTDKTYEDTWLDTVGLTRLYESDEGEEMWVTIIEWWDQREDLTEVPCITIALSSLKPIHREDPFLYLDLALACEPEVAR